MEKKDTTCNFCSLNIAKYTCPRCNALYCSQSCYQSENHLQCSEEFYKECIEKELKLENADSVQKKQMLEILNRFQRESEVDDIIDDNDSDDEDSIPDLSQRLQNIDLNNADEVWKHLTEQEKLEFNAIINSGEITHLIPEYVPWWNETHEKKIEELESFLNKENKKYKDICPLLQPRLPFSSLSKVQPSPCILWNIVNVLSSYAFTVRRYIGEHCNVTAASTIINLSTNLSFNQNFETKEAAIESVVYQANNHADITCSPEEAVILREDVDKLLSGPETSEIEFYILAALSDLQRLLSDSLKRKKSIGKKTEFSTKYPVPVEIIDKEKARKSIKKLTFYMSWINEFYNKNIVL